MQQPYLPGIPHCSCCFFPVKGSQGHSGRGSQPEANCLTVAWEDSDLVGLFISLVVIVQLLILKSFQLAQKSHVPVIIQFHQMYVYEHTLGPGSDEETDIAN